jgi:hypothetical protein
MQEQFGQLERVGEDWAAAEMRGDTASLGRILAEDFVAVGPRGFMLSRHDSGSLTYGALAWDEVEVRVHGEAAVTIGRQTASAVYQNGDVRHEIQDQFRTTLVFVEEQGRWLLLILHLSPIAEPPAGFQAQNADGPEEGA